MAWRRVPSHTKSASLITLGGTPATQNQGYYTLILPWRLQLADYRVHKTGPEQPISAAPAYQPQPAVFKPEPVKMATTGSGAAR